MKKSVAALLILTFAMFTPSAFAVEGAEVMYVGGTITSVPSGAVGKLDTTQLNQLVYTAPSGSLNIPYANIESYVYTREIAHHLGVVPTLAIVMVKYRQRRHYFKINYKDENNVEQSVVFEVPKEMPKTLFAVLGARAPKACNNGPGLHCPATTKSHQ